MSIFERTIGLLTPPECVGCGAEGTSLCIGCAESEILPFGERCWNCGRISPRARTCVHCRYGGAPRSVWVTTDYAGLAKTLLRAYKFGHRRAASRDISRLMAETLKQYNGDDDLSQADYLVVAVPTATGRVRERGFDHAQLLARQIVVERNLECYSGLSRLGQARQVGAKRSTRLTQQTQSYYVRNPDKIDGRNILLIDDVVTTGATLRAATKALRSAGARHVDGLVFAKRL